MSEIKGCMNCGNISCPNNKKRNCAGCGRYISSEDKIKEYETQIEKMKCCYNCSKWNDGECEESPKTGIFFCADFKCDNWEMFK